MKHTGAAWNNIASRLWDLSMQLPVQDGQPYAELHFNIMDTIESRSATANITINLTDDEETMVSLALAMPEGAIRGA